MKLRFTTAIILGLMLLFSTAQADQKVVFNGYELHYIAFNSTMLTPEIAAQYGLVRSGQRALLNLSVLEQRRNDVAVPVANAEVSVRVRNLLGQSNRLEMRVIEEQNARYFIGTVSFDDREMLWFDIVVSIPGERDFEYSFSQEFWEEEG
ncbi:DUF4426 domain-containing protein [Saccharospirillum impatiens]|uniref:DUF4426 domain-containing protein n=1 Tax=Saccharospirillum impatiens TaxID=169438 RepID=UPI00041B8D2D|nr:DUF4426 domain-containing protein [Saccharospirillum impatiens]